MKKIGKLNLSNQIKRTEETNIGTNENRYNPINTNSSASDKKEFLDNLSKDIRKDSFINILVKEALKINQMYSYKKKVNEINLKEDDIEGLYDWSSLFNNGRPLSHYTRTNYKKPVIKKNENNLNIKSPQILVDLPNDKMQYFFGKNCFGNNNSTTQDKKYTPNFRKNTKKNDDEKINKTATNNNTTNIKHSNKNKNNTRFFRLPTWHFPYKNRPNNIKSKNLKEERKTDLNPLTHIQPVSIYEQYGQNNTFYFSNTFSDYYKEDLKAFSKKMPILKAKIKTNPKRLKTEIKKQKNELDEKEKILYDLIKKDDLNLRKQDLIISAERRNPVPLLKYIFKQNYPEAQEIKEHIKKYFKTMKPYGNDDGKVDYTQNDRWKLSNELIKYRKMEYKLEKEKKKKELEKKKRKRKLILNYYDNNDPDLDIFNKLNIDNEDNANNLYTNKKNYSFESKNNFTNSFDFELELKNKAKTIENDKMQRPRTGYKRAKDLNILNNEKNIVKNRPHSSKMRRNNNLDDRYYFDIRDFNELYKDYLPSNRFPVKTSSKINNTSYNKINELIKERFFNKKLNANYFITEPDLKLNLKIENDKYNSYNNSKSLYLNAYNGNKNKSTLDKSTKMRPCTAIGLRKKQYTVIDFNKYIDTNLDLKVNKFNEHVYFTPMNCFNKLAGKYYSSSNNVNIKNKRNKRKQILDDYPKKIQKNKKIYY